jgi:hypothetical protein
VLTTLPGATSAPIPTAINPVGVSLTWTPPTGNGAITGYMVYRSDNGGTSWTAANGTLTPGSPFTDTTAAGNTNYIYNVVAYNATGPGVASAASKNVLTVPAAPTVSVAVQAGPKVVLTLTSTGNGTITGYTFLRRTVGVGVWGPITLTKDPSSVSSYADSTVGIGFSYNYRVTATNAAGTSPNSATATAVVAVPGLPTLTRSGTGAQAALSWTVATGSIVTSIQIERATTNAGPWGGTIIATVPATPATYTDTDPLVVPGKTFYYRITAINVLGPSTTPSTVLTVPVLAAPTVLTATAGATNSRTITLGWKYTNNNQTGFVLDRSTDGGKTWTLNIAPITANTTSYTNTGLTRGTTYTYRIRASYTVGRTTYYSDYNSTPNASATAQ